MGEEMPTDPDALIWVAEEVRRKPDNGRSSAKRRDPVEVIVAHAEWLTEQGHEVQAWQMRTAARQVQYDRKNLQDAALAVIRDGKPADPDAGVVCKEPRCQNWVPVPVGRSRPRLFCLSCRPPRNR
jgi:hypothetical protein